MKTRVYFISYGFIDANGVNRIDNCKMDIKEKEVNIKEIQNEIGEAIDSKSIRILSFTELEDYEVFE